MQNYHEYSCGFFFLFYALLLFLSSNFISHYVSHLSGRFYWIFLSTYCKHENYVLFSKNVLKKISSHHMLFKHVCNMYDTATHSTMSPSISSMIISITTCDTAAYSVQFDEHLNKTESTRVQELF